jgi:hypothetical protein
MKSLSRLTKSTRRKWGRSSWKTRSRSMLGKGWGRGSGLSKRGKRGSGVFSKIMNLSRWRR